MAAHRTLTVTLVAAAVVVLEVEVLPPPLPKTFLPCLLPTDSSTRERRPSSSPCLTRHVSIYLSFLLVCLGTNNFRKLSLNPHPFSQNSSKLLGFFLRILGGQPVATYILQSYSRWLSGFTSQFSQDFLTPVVVLDIYLSTPRGGVDYH